MIQHQLFIQRCFDLAKLGAGKVSPNPKVGAVIVYKNRIIGEGFHQSFGEAHAEINAINSLKDKTLLKKATLYVSLEPCNHYGKTPPCVDTILKYQIPRVFISMVDPNPKTMGKSIAKLKAAGVELTYNVLPRKGKETIKKFLSTFQKNRPYVILKYAQSANQKIGIAGTNTWISNAFTKRLTHKWRSEINAIIVGTNTFLTDNPKLDNRFYFGPSPLKLILKRDGKIPKNAAAIQSKGKFIVVTSAKTKNIEYKNVTQWKIPFDHKLLKNILLKLKKEGINALLVEGGATLINSFLQQGLWDEARVFTANHSIDHPKSIDAPIPKGTLTHSFQIGNNKLTVYKNQLLAPKQ